ncbi:hypothetical protein [Actinoallomurus purpureus]|uniref:hypothetical protein n=1 Tax=Actinoallomurus purpureus TaxID=478114 RepID=UPI0025B02495|nr:hypothetical protein [Actinoallomurus purpureus]
MDAESRHAVMERPGTDPPVPEAHPTVTEPHTPVPEAVEAHAAVVESVVAEVMPVVAEVAAEVAEVMPVVPEVMAEVMPVVSPPRPEVMPPEVMSAEMTPEVAAVPEVAAMVIILRHRDSFATALRDVAASRRGGGPGDAAPGQIRLRGRGRCREQRGSDRGAQQADSGAFLRQHIELLP